MLTACPRCNYSLKGLPAEHTCAECRLIYDADSEIFRHRNPSRVVWAGLGGALGVMILTIGPAGDVLRIVPVSMRPLFVVLWLVALIVFFLSAAAALYYRKTRGFLVAILPGGLLPRLAGDEQGVIPWGEIVGVAADRFRKIVILRIGKELKTIRIRGFFRNDEEIDAFMAKVNARRAATQSC